MNSFQVIGFDSVRGGTMTNGSDHLSTLRAVALAYRLERKRGHGDFEAYQAAMQAYRQLHPEDADDAAGYEVARLIFEASERAGPWLYGVREGS